MVVDLDSGKILYEKNSTNRVPIASLTKLMTGIIIAEEETPHTIVKVSERASGIEGSKVWLNSGEEISVKNLMYGMMIASGNDAAVALSEFNAGSLENFVKKMNEKSEKLGLKNTHFSNPMGFDENTNYSTAEDMAILSMLVLKKPILVEASEKDRYKIQSESGIEHEVVTTNKLLTENQIIGGFKIEGLKTGTTPEAGECLITRALNPEGHEILTVVLGSKDRFSDTKGLINWVAESYSW
ncbi:MAG: Serine-type D-Ala-D-Ala carboxypeptidase [Candidatus Peregrinibacteria bacterium GW2011_GWA2_44_7]|nr:MAG: Serine-type D-Ala-D-Ala carboxypeptidase [Candidatus Peregrinibacteria bacterium GW2011_GWA2_44_7]